MVSLVSSQSFKCYMSNWPKPYKACKATHCVYCTVLDRVMYGSCTTTVALTIAINEVIASLTCVYVQLFCDAKREEIKALNPGAGLGATAKLLAAAWKDCPAEDMAKEQSLQVCLSVPLGTVSSRTWHVLALSILCTICKFTEQACRTSMHQAVLAETHDVLPSDVRYCFAH